MARGWTSLAMATLLVAAPLAAQEPGNPEVQQQIQNIMRERRPEMEAAARGFLAAIAPDRASPRGNGLPAWPMLDSLKTANLDAYWMEVAQLDVQLAMFQNVVTRDTARTRLMVTMFGTEFEARAIQRSWRQASEAQRRAMRTQLEALMSRHFDAEQALRGLEAVDAQRRIQAILAETQRRNDRKAELVRWAVDDIIHGAERPE